jgi:Flp pilus assembly protein TadG
MTRSTTAWRGTLPGTLARERERRRGAAAAELALLLPFLGLMFGAALDFAGVFYVTQTLESAAYAGALYASGTAWSASASTDAASAAQAAACADAVSLVPPLQPANVTVAFTSTTATVSVSYDYQLLTPMIGALLGSSGTVTLQRTVTLNQAPTPGN